MKKKKPAAKKVAPIPTESHKKAMTEEYIKTCTRLGESVVSKEIATANISQLAVKAMGLIADIQEIIKKLEEIKAKELRNGD